MTVPARFSAFFALIALMAPLGGCASNDGLSSVLVAPGKFRLYNCPELVQRQKAIVVRQRELEALMTKAERDSGGRFVSAVAYETDYATTKGEMRELLREGAAKNCNLPDPSTIQTSPAPSPAAAPKRAATPPKRR